MLKMGFTLLLLLLCITRLCNSQVIEAKVGVFFWREFTPESFNFTEANNERYSIYYSVSSSVSSQPFAGLPDWLSFYHRNSSSSGILYGTPSFTDVGRLDVQVIALNRKSFESIKLIIALNVTEHVMKTEYFIDLFVANVNFDTLLMGDVLKNFSSVMQLVLQSEELLLEDVVHPTFRGDSLPLPTGGKRYEGVYVVFGNVIQDYDRASNEDIRTVMEPCRISNVNLSDLPLHYESTQQFSIDWCKINLTKKFSPAVTPEIEPAVNATSAASLVDGSAERNIAIVISFLILFVIAIILSFIFISVCYHRYQSHKRVDKLGKKYQKRDIWKSSEAMVITNAQQDLREMSSLPPLNQSVASTTSSPLPLPSTDMQAEMTDPPPYQYPRHLTDLFRLSEDEITLEPAALSAYM